MFNIFFYQVLISLILLFFAADIQDIFPYFLSAVYDPLAWINEIRHKLSLNEALIQLGRTEAAEAICKGVVLSLNMPEDYLIGKDFLKHLT